MAFPLKDVRLTSRRGEGDLPLLYPRLLRDRSILPKIDIAIQYLESMLGRERRELEPEVLVHFFGDHKLARCVLACLARSYRYRSPRIEELVTRGGLARLRRARIDSPRALRLALFDHVNDFGHGFLEPGERASAVASLERRYALRAGELERLLFLDAEEHARLGRQGGVPRAADVAAQYNFGVLESLLRQAEQVQLDLSPGAAATRDLARALADAHGVGVVSSSSRVALQGGRDALGGWSRHGRRLARTVSLLLDRAGPTVVGGQAVVALKERRAALRLTDESLPILGAHAGPAELPGEDGVWDPAGLLGEAAAWLRAPRIGWRVRATPDPQAWAGGLLVPELLARPSGSEGALYAVAVRSTAHAERLAPLALAARTGEPYLFAGSADALLPLGASGVPTAALEPWMTPAQAAEALRASLEPVGPAAALAAALAAA